MVKFLDNIEGNASKLGGYGPAYYLPGRNYCAALLSGRTTLIPYAQAVVQLDQWNAAGSVERYNNYYVKLTEAGIYLVTATVRAAGAAGQSIEARIVTGGGVELRRGGAPVMGNSIASACVSAVIHATAGYTVCLGAWCDGQGNVTLDSGTKLDVVKMG